MNENRLNRGTHVRVVADTRDGYHFFPIGTRGILELDVRPGDVFAQVRATERGFTKAGHPHSDRLLQCVPLADLEVECQNHPPADVCPGYEGSIGDPNVPKECQR